MKNTTDIYTALATSATLAWSLPCGHGFVEGRRPANIRALAGRHVR
jgi:hypothetical protein